MSRLALPLLVLLGLTGCLEVDGYTLWLDLGSNTGTVVFHDIRSAPMFGDEQAPIDDDLTELLDEHVNSADVNFDSRGLNVLAWDVKTRELVEHDGHLDGVLSFAFEGRKALRLGSYSADFPTRLCPSKGIDIVATNAAMREANGCLSWGPGATVLRFEGRDGVSRHSVSLLDAWKAKGKP